MFVFVCVRSIWLFRVLGQTQGFGGRLRVFVTDLGVWGQTREFRAIIFTVRVLGV